MIHRCGDCRASDTTLQVDMMIDADFLKDSEIIIQKLMKIPAMRALEKRHLQALLEMSDIIEFEPGSRSWKKGGSSGVFFI